jgi:hypothetical protein
MTDALRLESAIAIVSCEWPLLNWEPEKCYTLIFGSFFRNNTALVITVRTPRTSHFEVLFMRNRDQSHPDINVDLSHLFVEIAIGSQVWLSEVNLFTPEVDAVFVLPFLINEVPSLLDEGTLTLSFRFSHSPFASRGVPPFCGTAIPAVPWQLKRCLTAYVRVPWQTDPVPVSEGPWGVLDVRRSLTKEFPWCLSVMRHHGKVVSDYDLLASGDFDLREGLTLDFVMLPKTATRKVRLKFGGEGRYGCVHVYLDETVKDMARLVAEMGELPVDCVWISDHPDCPKRQIFTNEVALWNLDLSMTFLVTVRDVVSPSPTARKLPDGVKINSLSEQEMEEAKALVELKEPRAVLEEERSIPEPPAAPPLRMTFRSLPKEKPDFAEKVATLAELGVPPDRAAEALRNSRYSVSRAVESLFPGRSLMRTRRHNL